VPSPGKPIITANQVTVARLIPMPLLAWLLYKGAESGYAGNAYMWSALIAGTLIGCTDWVDGMLARKYGPTVLGGLLDPIADKIFIAFAYVPFADDNIALVPAWACALMFMREFFITALRSVYEQRGLAMKTSYIAKVKTWTQMQGIGVLLLFPLLADNRPALTWLLGSLTAAPLVVMAYFFVVKRKFWRGALVMSGSVAPILALHLYGDIQLSMNWIMLAVVAITWISGLDYIIVGWPKLRAHGDFNRADAVRLLGGLGLPCLLFAVLVETPAPSWPIFAILSLELAVGGLDNLMSHHKKATRSLAWGSRVLGICGLLGLALLVPDYATYFAAAATLVSLVGVAAEFWRGRDYFLDKRIRDKALREKTAVDPRDYQLQDLPGDKPRE
jgi:CDP-diacylglycerol--glycerol-3-phosphate 3-phosphatidyltransferase